MGAYGCPHWVGLCIALHLCLITQRDDDEGLHDPQVSPSDALASMKWLVVLCSIGLHKMMVPMKMKSHHLAHLY